MHITPYALPRLNRRGFLQLGGRGIGYAGLMSALAACGGGGGDATGEEPPPPPPDSGIAKASAEYQLVKRSGFGVSAARLAEAQSLGVAGYLERQLAFESLDASRVESEIARVFPLANGSYAQLRPRYPQDARDLVLQLLGATLYRQYFSPRQLYESMAEFWSNHFNIHLINGLGPVFKPIDDRTVIRPRAMATFPELLFASARSPAMLYYLDNFLNTKDAPNENYARELLELHTLGVDGGYDEDDIKEVARCFTGWTVNFNTGAFVFNASQHDNGSKTVLGTAIAAGGGVGDGEKVLELLAAHPATARHLAQKLCRRFVADAPASALVDAVAASFSASGGDIRATLRSLFTAPQFRASADIKFMRPSEFVGQLMATLNPTQAFPADQGLTAITLLNLLGQLPFYWPPPDGYPDVSAHWATTSGLLNRWRVGLGLNLFGGGAGAVRAMVGTATTVAQMVDAGVANFLLRPLESADRQLIIDWLVDETGQPADTTLPSGAVDAAAPALIALLASSAYFQLR